MRELGREKFNVDDAWNVHLQTRGKEEGRNAGELHIQKAELQRKLDNYREAVKQDFGVEISVLEQPKDFLAKRNFKKELSEVSPAQWYSSLERMRAYELTQYVEAALSTVKLPEAGKDKKLQFTDVGSRSNFFGSLMAKRHKDQDWKMVDIENQDLPAKVKDESRYNVLNPFDELPKSDVITLNCVLHHVGEIDGEHGKFDDKKIDKFLKTINNALPKNGVVVVVEDFIGKDKVNRLYNDFIKGVDELFYPQSLGNQKLSKEWVEKFEKNGFSLVKEEYPIGFNVVGLPVVETCLVFRKKS